MSERDTSSAEAPRLGRFRLRAPLDASGAIWSAVHEGLGIEVLVRFSDDPRFVAETQAEAAAPHLSRPTILDLGQDGDGRAWRAETRARGVRLDRVLAERRSLPEPDAEGVLVQLAELYASAIEAGYTLPAPGLRSVWLSRGEGGSTVMVQAVGDDAEPTRTVAPTGVDCEPDVLGSLLRMASQLTGGGGLPGFDRVLLAWRASHRGTFPLLPGAETGGAPLRPTSGSNPEVLRSLVAGLRADRPQSDLPPGRGRLEIGRRYEVLNTLGEGGMGVVYRALDLQSGRVVSLKTAHGGATASAAVLREFQILSELQHPHLLEVLDYGVDPHSGPFLVSALYEHGRDLLAASASASLSDRLELIAQLGDALAHLHAHGVLHRDLKPANVVVVDGHVRLLDFGISAVEDDVTGAPRAGTPGFLAPEVRTGGACSRASDLWAFGRVASLVLLGGADARMARPGVLLADAPAEIESVLAPLLAKAPEARPAGAGGVVVELRRLARRMEGSASRPTPPSARFLGREREVGYGASALLSLARGRGGALCFEGAHGAGKSRLLSRLRTTALIEGFSAVACGAFRREAGAHGPWFGAIAWWSANAELDPATRATFARLEPTLAAKLAVGPPDKAAPSPAEFVDQVLTAFSLAAEQACRPLVLLVDDADRLGEADRRILSALWRATAHAPLLVLTTATVGDGFPPDNRVSIAPLSPEEARAIARSLGLPESAAEEGIEAGNPGILHEAVEDARSGRDARLGRAERRVVSLGEPARRALAIAAALGETIDADLLARLDGGALRETLAAALEEGDRLGIVAGSGDALRFSPGRFQDVLLATLDEATRAHVRRDALAHLERRAAPPAARIAALHLCLGAPDRAAPWLRQAGDDAFDVGDLAGGAALHAQAGPPADPVEAVAWGTRLGEVCYVRGRRTEAVRWLRTAVAAAGRPLPHTSTGWAWLCIRELATLALLPRALRRKGVANLSHPLRLSGLCAYSDSEPVKGTLLTLAGLNNAIDWSDAVNTVVLLSGLHLVMGTVGLHRLARMLAVRLDAARARLGPDEHAEVSYAAEAYYLVGVGAFDEARARATVAEAALRAQGKLRSADEALLALAWCEQARGAFRESVPLFERLDANAGRRDDMQSAVWARTGIVYAHLSEGAPDDALRVLDTCAPAGVPDDSLLPVLRGLAQAVRADWLGAWESAKRGHAMHAYEVHGRGVHLATIYLLCDVLSRLACADDPAIRPVRAQIGAALRARLRQLRRCVPVAPIAGPWLHLAEARRARAAGDHIGATRELARGRAAALALGMRLDGLLAPLAAGAEAAAHPD
jgi:hypothetical protein